MASRRWFDSATEFALDTFAASPTFVLFQQWQSVLQDEIDSLNLRRLANDFRHRLQAQRSAKYE